MSSNLQENQIEQYEVLSNIVDKKNLRKVQTATLKNIRQALINSFGPYGSNTEIVKKNSLNRFTKDGHTILSSIRYFNIIEESVRTELEELTRYITITIGDGTTSAVILADIIFNKLRELEETNTPYELMNGLKEACELVENEIRKRTTELTPEAVYNIALTSTNGNEDVSEALKMIYELYGNGVFINVCTSTNHNSYLKTFDGLTLSTGYSDTAYINNTKNKTATVNNARIYAFQDPVDTPEMIRLFNTIVDNNIIIPYSQNKPEDVKPTVIFAPKLTRDIGSRLETIIDFMHRYTQAGQDQNKPPLLIVTNINQPEEYADIVKLSGARFIKKYLDPKQQQADIDAGLAPTPETVCSDNFAGYADIVESSALATKIVNPKAMFTVNENGERVNSPEYTALLDFVQKTLDEAIDDGSDINVIGNLKRRLNSLKANMVEYYIGGITMSDRDSLKDLVEDAVLNCRSASDNGYGCGSNIEGLIASGNITDNKFVNIIHDAYKELVQTLYGTCMSKEKAEEIQKQCLINKSAYNIKTGKFDNSVLSSIESDIIILDTVCKIVSIMFTCNQFLCESFAQNKYLQL